MSYILCTLILNYKWVELKKKSFKLLITTQIVIWLHQNFDFFFESQREKTNKNIWTKKRKENRLHRSGTMLSILKTIIGTLIFIVFTTSEQRRSCIRWETVTICQTIRHTRTINNYKIIPWSTWENSWKNRKLYTSNNSKPIVTSSHQSTVLF